MRVYQRTPTRVHAVQYQNNPDHLTELAPTITVRDDTIYVHDWDTFQWAPLRPTDWLVRDARGVCRPMDDVTFQQNYTEATDAR